MFEMLTGCRCFNGGNNTSEVRSNVLNKKMEEWPPDVLISSNAMDFFNKLLEFEPLKRFSCQQALRHDWLYDLWQNRENILFNNNSRSRNQYISPRLTPLQSAVQSPPQQPMNDVSAMQAIVIRTSQSMTNLQTVFKQQLEARKQNKQNQRKLQRKYKDSLDEAQESNGNNMKSETKNEEEEDDEEDSVPWKLRITRKKSRSLEQNELRATLRKDGGTFHRLSLPTHEKQNQYKYRKKQRAATLSNHHPHPQNVVISQKVRFRPQKPENIENPNILNTDNDMNDINMIQTHSPSISDNNSSNSHSIEHSPDNSPIHRLKHQKSLSSPSMNISIHASKLNMKHSVINGGYRPSPVHEDYEHNEQEILKNQHFYDSSGNSTNGSSQVQSSWRTHTNSKSSSNNNNLLNNNGQSSISYTGHSSYHHQKNHSNSFSIVTNEHSQSYTNEDIHFNVNDDSNINQKFAMITDTVIEDKTMD